MNICIQEQIDAQEKYIKHIEESLPRSIAASRITMHRAEQLVLHARAILNTLVQVKRLAQGEVQRSEQS